MTQKKYFIALLAIMGLMPLNSATAQIEDNEIVELLDSKLEQRGQRITGPISAITPAALLIASFDTDFDYAVSAPEITAGLARSFTIADKDGGGHLSLMELQNWRRAALGDPDASPPYLAFDKNYDQRISKDEFVGVLSRSVDRSDKNKDGVIEFSELIRVFEMPRGRALGEEETERPRPEGRGQGNGQGGGRPPR